MNIDNLLQKLQLNNDYKKYGILLASIMFIWSGINKIHHFDDKVLTLMKKINLDENICMLGMILVILLEIIGFLFLNEYYFKKQYFYNLFKKINVFIKLSQKQLIQIILILLLLFLIVVTLIYHPLNLERPIPFLSNVNCFGLFLYVYCDLFN